MANFAACWEGLEDPRTGNAGLHDFHELLMIALCSVLCSGQGAVSIAAPIINGGHDPLPRRTGWRKGIENDVVLPALRDEPRRERIVSAGATGRAGGRARALADLGDGEGLEGFHAPLRTATMLYARECVCSGFRDDVALKAQLHAAMDATPRRVERGDLSAYDDGYLDRLIGGAFALLPIWGTFP